MSTIRRIAALLVSFVLISLLLSVSYADQEHHKIIRGTLQQVISSDATDGQQFHYAHTQIEWKQESSQQQVEYHEEVYVHNSYEAMFPVPVVQDTQLDRPGAQQGYVQNTQQPHHNQDHPHQHLPNTQQHQQLQHSHPQEYHLAQQQQDHHLNQRRQQQPHQHHVSHIQHIHHVQQIQYHQYHPLYSVDQSEHDIDQNNHLHHHNYNNRPVESCDYHDAPVLIHHQMHPQQQPTCRAASSTDRDVAAAQHGSGSAGNVPNLSRYSNKPSHNSNIESYPLAQHPSHPYESSLTSAIRHYWMEISGLCLATAIFLNWLFVIVKRRFLVAASVLTRSEPVIETLLNQAQQSQPSQSIAGTSSEGTQSTRAGSKDTNSSAHDSAFEEILSPISLGDISSSKSSSDNVNNLKPSKLNQQQLDQSTQSVKTAAISTTGTIRQRSSTLRAADPIAIPIVRRGHNSASVSLSNSLNSSEYNSRYSSDFDSIQRLGHGGFGVVFEAKNKIDDCHYAVKRICLPLEKEARERVMREVRALAKLDHAGIVRYYNAWLETPPEDWLKQHDAKLGILHGKDGGMRFSSTDGLGYICDTRNETEHITTNAKGNGRGGNKDGCCVAFGGATNKLLCSDSGDNSSGLFGNGPFQRGANGLRRLLKNNSSSPSLDIVFEGSGSIRLETKNDIGRMNSDDDDDDDNDENDNTNEAGQHIRKAKNLRKHNKNNGDIVSDSEDSDFIQFESKIKQQNNGFKKKERAPSNIQGASNDEFSMSSHLTDPFDSTSSNEGDETSMNDDSEQELDDSDATTNKCDSKSNQLVLTAKNAERRMAMLQQKELRYLNCDVEIAHRDASPGEKNLHVEKVYLYIQMQLCRKDTLRDWLKTNYEERDKVTIFDLFYQIVDAVEYVHSQDLIHRDLKPSNIFFSLDGTLKIGDFGLCRTKTSVGIGSSLDLQEYAAESDLERGIEAVHTEQVGTQLYMSPEQLNGMSYNQKVDIFAMGLILLELLVPFKTQMQRVNVLFKARNNLYSDEFMCSHPREYQLVKSLLSRSPLKRPTATEIKQHELLASAQLSQPVIERIYHRRRTISSNSSNE